MRRLQILASTVITAALAMGASACTDAGNPMLIIGNQSPQPLNAGGCQVNTNLTSTARTAGVWDVLNPGGVYDLFPVIQNALPADNNDSNQNFILLEGFDIEYQYQEGFVDQLPEDAQAVLRANQATTFLASIGIPPNGLAVLGAPVFNPPISTAIINSGILSGGATAQVVIEMKAFGSLDGGTAVSTPFRFPITICENCLVIDTGPCGANPTVGSGYPCGGFQDVATTCCTDNGNLICPAVADQTP